MTGSKLITALLVAASLLLVPDALAQQAGAPTSVGPAPSKPGVPPTRQGSSKPQHEVQIGNRRVVDLGGGAQMVITDDNPVPQKPELMTPPSDQLQYQHKPQPTT